MPNSNGITRWEIREMNRKDREFKKKLRKESFTKWIRYVIPEYTITICVILGLLATCALIFFIFYFIVKIILLIF